MTDQIDPIKPEDLSNGDRPLSIPSELPILPLRDTVLFPNSFMPLAVARESSVISVRTRPLSASNTNVRPAFMWFI